nr:cytochrome c biogenesis protein CcsA [Desulfobulbaceae bacterium]
MDFVEITGQIALYGNPVIYGLFLIGILAGLLGTTNIFSKSPVGTAYSRYLLYSSNILFLLGFGLICWLHYRIYTELPLLLPESLSGWINKQITSMNSQAAYSFALYDANSPPRYAIPLWIENEKYFFWFMCYSAMAQAAFNRLKNHRIQGALLLFLAAQILIIFFVTNPFVDPLPQFFAEITPWFQKGLAPMEQFGLFMKLYPKMIFYYNASYMWLHPPMLFLSYAAITITFITSSFMLINRELEVEILGYDFAKFGYFMLTLGMLLGYPWALKAWGPNWWWDPKICSSIMMWAIYSTYLHTRLYANKKSMWYFTSILGILCFLAMLFTFVSSFFFPGEHTFQ